MSLADDVATIEVENPTLARKLEESLDAAYVILADTGAADRFNQVRAEIAATAERCRQQADAT